MLEFITEIPVGKQIGGVHCVPVLKNGNMVMVWDKEQEVSIESLQISSIS